MGKRVRQGRNGEAEPRADPRSAIDTGRSHLTLAWAQMWEWLLGSQETEAQSTAVGLRTESDDRNVKSGD